MHIDCVEPVELIRFCADRKYICTVPQIYGRSKQYLKTITHCTIPEQFPEIDELKLSTQTLT